MERGREREGKKVEAKRERRERKEEKKEAKRERGD